MPARAQATSESRRADLYISVSPDGLCVGYHGRVVDFFGLCGLPSLFALALYFLGVYGSHRYALHTRKEGKEGRVGLSVTECLRDMAGGRERYRLSRSKVHETCLEFAVSKVKGRECFSSQNVTDTSRQVEATGRGEETASGRRLPRCVLL